MTPRVHLYVLVLPWAVLFALGLMFERPEFRPYELMIRGKTHFHPSRTIEMDAHGALAYRYNAPQFESPVHNVFSTDRSGFRNPVITAPPKVVVAGDSFVVGVGVSDDETIPARLGHHLGTAAYNFGTQGAVAPVMFLTDPRFARRPPPVLVYMPSATVVAPIEMPERVDPSAVPPPLSPKMSPPSSLDCAARWWRRQGRPLRQWLMVAGRDNGLKKRAQRDYHAARREVFGFPERIEVDGAPALVLTLEEQKLHQTPAERQVDEVVRSWRAFADANAERGTKVLFVPLPESADLYLDAFFDRARAVEPSFLDTLFERAGQAGLDTHDLRPTLTSSRSPYLFLRDDTHYAPHAIDIVARETAARVRRSTPL